MPARTRTTALLLACLTVTLFRGGAPLRAQQPTPAPATASVTQISPGLTYQHLQPKGPAGEPWSVHVLRLARGAKGLRLAAAGGVTTEGRMARNLPTDIARAATNRRERPLAVVNGDYDLAAPYLGISDGLSVTSGRLWTTSKPDWPALALLANGGPAIAVPEIRIELRAGRRRIALGGLNKPLGSGHGGHPRAYTREYASHLRSSHAFRAVVIGKISPALPLQVDRTVRGVVLETVASVTELAIPPGAIVVAEWTEDSALGSAASGVSPTRGEKVALDFRVRVAGHTRVRQAIGGFPILVRDSRRSIEGQPSAYLSLRHPRTAVCTSPREIIFVVVDGRQPKLSVGMTLIELADLMLSLGCTTAMNTDGGGSSVMAISARVLPGGRSFSSDTSQTKKEAAGASAPDPPASTAPSLRIVNSPSDGSERGRGNAWVILKKK